MFFSYEAPPPVKDKLKDEEKPEDCIPDTPANREAREFLAKAPTKGLWTPLGKEVKVMKCWRCKTYGHRTGDKECPLFLSGNQKAEAFRHTHEDPMYQYVKDVETQKKLEKVEMLKKLLQSDDESKKKEKKRKKKDKHKDKNKKTKKSKHRSRKSSTSSFSSSSSSSSTNSSASGHSNSHRKKQKKSKKSRSHYKHDRKHNEKRHHKRHRSISHHSY